MLQIIQEAEPAQLRDVVKRKQKMRATIRTQKEVGLKVILQITQEPNIVPYVIVKWQMKLKHILGLVGVVGHIMLQLTQEPDVVILAIDQILIQGLTVGLVGVVGLKAMQIITQEAEVVIPVIDQILIRRRTVGVHGRRR
jgi:hypothetical protein